MPPATAEGDHDLAHFFEFPDFVEKILGTEAQASPACVVFHAMREHHGDHRRTVIFNLPEQFDAVGYGDVEYGEMWIAAADALDGVVHVGGANDHARHVING